MVASRFDNTAPQWLIDVREVHPDLERVICTSGTTGSEKHVKLSMQNCESNAEAIRKSLPILPDDVALVVLSPIYAYGISVITTHEHVWCPDVLNITFGTRAFWKGASDNNVTTLPILPGHLDVLANMQFEKQLPKTLRYVTIAGGKVNAEHLKVLKRFRSAGVRTFVMYGQSEATARITCLEADDDTKPGCVGKPIHEDGKITIDPETSEILYEGPNVFCGYATCAEDLLTCEPVKVLHTGDVGRIDERGNLWITGRLKRIAKINGKRTSLDELETLLSAECGTTILCVSDDVFVYCCSTHAVTLPSDLLPGSLKNIVCKVLLKPSGKVDYESLLNYCSSQWKLKLLLTLVCTEQVGSFKLKMDSNDNQGHTRFRDSDSDFLDDYIVPTHTKFVYRERSHTSRPM